MINPPGLPQFSDVLAARDRLAGYAVKTHLIESPVLNKRTGGRILIKPECLQRTGSFKFRGAWNRISQLPESAHEAGVVAYSSGNHAQGVAAAAQLMGIPALIVMPRDTPEIKKNNTESYGAEVVTYDRASESREEIAAEFAKERGAIIVPPYDDRDVIAGQGTCGLELAHDAAALHASLDAVLVCASGGGLTAGCALAINAITPGTEVYCVEPTGFDDHARSLKSGKREKNARTTGSICDALLTPEPGEITFAINQQLLTGGLVVDDEEVKEAMRFAFDVLKLVVEPGGAVALAAVLSGKLPCKNKTVGVVLSGGNADRQLYSEILADKQD